MTDFMKASYILSYLAKMSHDAAWLNEEDILSSPQGGSDKIFHFFFRLTTD